MTAVLCRYAEANLFGEADAIFGVEEKMSAERSARSLYAHMRSACASSMKCVQWGGNMLALERHADIQNQAGGLGGKIPARRVALLSAKR